MNEELHPLPWRAYKCWIFDANDNHVIYEGANLSHNEAERIVSAVNARIALETQVKVLEEALDKAIQVAFDGPKEPKGNGHESYSDWKLRMEREIKAITPPSEVE